ncbi:MAG: GNAT family N-acetyltransferase [Chloroflexota bacterium]
MPEGQGGGWGLKLMEAFWEKLRSMGVPAVHLGVSKANENAVGFYKHIGYHVISEHDWGYMLGKKLEPGKDATKRLQDRVAFEKLAKTHNLDASASSIFAISEPCLHLASTISRDEDIPVGASKFGGDPDVPLGFEWPYWQNSFLSLLLQVNLSELQALFPTTDLPKTGLLSIFFEHNNDAVFMNPDDQESFQVYYFDKTDSLRRTNSPETPKFQFSYPPCKVEFKISRSFPSPISKVLHNVGMSDWEIDSSYSDLYYGHLELSNPKHQIFGHPFIHQDDDFGIKSQLLSNRISLKNNFVFTDESMSNKRKGAEDWILFFQIDTDTNTQMHWGISEGTLYFVIRKEQLEMHNFTEICLLRQYI